MLFKTKLILSLTLFVLKTVMSLTDLSYMLFLLFILGLTVALFPYRLFALSFYIVKQFRRRLPLLL